MLTTESVLTPGWSLTSLHVSSFSSVAKLGPASSFYHTVQPIATGLLEIKNCLCRNLLNNVRQVLTTTPKNKQNTAIKVTVSWNSKHLTFDIKYDVLKCNKVMHCNTHSYRKSTYHQFSEEGNFDYFFGLTDEELVKVKSPSIILCVCVVKCTKHCNVQHESNCSSRSINSHTLYDCSFICVYGQLKI